MGMLVDGQWNEQDQRRTGTKGEFVRTQSTFRDVIGGSDGQYPGVAGRYHLFVNAGCPWAYRTLLYRAVKGLGEVISVSFTQPAMGNEGWTFGEHREAIVGARHIHDVYTQAVPNYTGRTTVPVLWDIESQTIVNNESSEIIRMLNAGFDHLAGVSPTNYYPAKHADAIDGWNEKIYATVNNGVYRCGFAQTQQAYESAYDQLFETLDEIESHLGTHRYLCGDVITEADWRLFATLVRFDVAYYARFRCNRNRLSDFANLWPYTRDLYQQPQVAQTVDVEAIKGIYFGGTAPGILPKGPVIDFAAPHYRA